MVNVEELDAKPFINLLNEIGLPTRIKTPTVIERLSLICNIS